MTGGQIVGWPTGTSGPSSGLCPGWKSWFERLNPISRSLAPTTPRSELLEQIHLAGAMEQRDLFRLLDGRDMSHTWIGAQVGSEFLEMWQAADGKTFYRVTPRAVQELQLG